MNKSDVLDHFSSRTECAQFLGVTLQTLRNWPDKLQEPQQMLVLGSFIYHGKKVPEKLKVAKQQSKT